MSVCKYGSCKIDNICGGLRVYYCSQPNCEYHHHCCSVYFHVWWDTLFLPCARGACLAEWMLPAVKFNFCFCLIRFRRCVVSSMLRRSIGALARWVLNYSNDTLMPPECRLCVGVIDASSTHLSASRELFVSICALCLRTFASRVCVCPRVIINPEFNYTYQNTEFYLNFRLFCSECKFWFM